MSTWAICSSSICRYRLRLQDAPKGISNPTPPSCPSCDSFLMTYCPACAFPIIASQNPQGRCQVCNCDMRQAFARSIYPRWLTQEQLTRMMPDHCIVPSIKRSDGSFYLVLANLSRRSRKVDVGSNLLAEFWYVREYNADTIESVNVRLSQPGRYVAVVENQLRHIADVLAAYLADGVFVSNEYEFNGEQLSEHQGRRAMVLA